MFVRAVAFRCRLRESRFNRCAGDSGANPAADRWAGGSGFLQSHETCGACLFFGLFCVAFCRRHSKDVETSHESCACASGGLPLPATGKPF